MAPTWCIEDRRPTAGPTKSRSREGDPGDLQSPVSAPQHLVSVWRSCDRPDNPDGRHMPFTGTLGSSPLGSVLDRFFCCCNSSSENVNSQVDITAEVMGSGLMKDEALAFPEDTQVRFPRAVQDNRTGRSIQLLKALRPTFHTNDTNMWLTLGAPSIQRRDGRWYYELKLGHGIARAQVGWVTDAFEEIEAKTRVGVGGDEHSWATDGQRMRNFHNAQETAVKWPREWRIGDVIGCAIDLDKGEMKFSLNGDWVSSATTFFHSEGRWFYPATSASGEFAFAFTAKTFKYAPKPDEYQPLCGPEDTIGIYERPKQSFSGRWTDGSSNILAIIKGSILTWPDGTFTRLFPEDVSNISMEFRGQIWRARLLPDGRLSWSDGEIWWRDEEDLAAQEASDNETADEAVLRRHFLGPYRQGLALERNFAGYTPDPDAWQEVLYSHKKTGTKVWSRVLDLTGSGSLAGQAQLLFHYVNPLTFKSITEFNMEAMELWTVLQESGIFGEGLYASQREPADFSSGEAIARNMYAMQLEEDPSSLPKWLERTRCCIPILAAKELSYDVRTRATPQMKRGVGKTVNGKSMPATQDLWVVRLPEPTVIGHARTNNEAVLRRMMEVKQQVYGASHVDTCLTATALAVCLKNNGKAKEASPLCAHTLEAYERSLGLEHVRTLACLKVLAQCLSDDGKDTEAELLLRRALEGSERALQADHELTCECAIELALRLQAKGHAKEAEPLLRRALEVRQEALGGETVETLFLTNQLALVLIARGCPEEAKTLYVQALKTRETSLGAEHPDTLESVHGLATCLQAKGELNEAEPLARRALESREKVLGPDHPRTLDSVASLAKCLREKGNTTEAMPLAQRAYNGRRYAYGTDHHRTLETAYILGLCLKDQQKIREAEPLFRKAFDGREQSLGAEDAETLAAAYHLASCLSRMGKAVDGQPLCRRVLRVRERTLGPDHKDTLDAMQLLAECLQNQHKADEAEPLLRQVLEGRERVLGVDHPDTLDSLFHLATCLYAQNKAKEAEPLLRRTLEGRERKLGADHASTLATVNGLSGCLYAQGKVAEAEKLLWRALKGSEKTHGQEHLDTLDCVYSLAVCLDSQGKAKEAEPFYKRAFEGRAKMLGKDHPNTVISAGGYAGCIFAQGRKSEAEPMLWRAVEGFKKLFGAEHPNTRTCVEHLVDCLKEQGRMDEAAVLMTRV